MAEDKFHIVINKAQQGPFGVSQIQAMIREGKVAPDALAWAPTLAGWKPWKEIPAIAQGMETKPEAQAPTFTIPNAPAPKAEPAGGLAISLQTGWLHDFIFFRKMITPWLIMRAGWILTGLCLLGGAGLFFKSLYPWNAMELLSGLGLLVIGPVVIRIYSEVTILFFQINETLTDIANQQKQGKGTVIP